MKRTLEVAGVQSESRNGRLHENLANAERFVVKAARGGAELILCPEFLATGYVYHRSIWRSAEPTGGPTERWLGDMARTQHAFVGASYLEASGDDFFNTFALAGPDGSIAGRVRKESLPAFEGWYFKSCPGDKVIDTPLGRIAVGICNDNMTSHFLRKVHAAAPDLLLMPHSAPTVKEIPLATGIVCDCLARVAPRCARALGVPALLVNKFSSEAQPSPFPVFPGWRFGFEFRGGSTICDADGRVLDGLPEGEGLVTAEVTLDPAKKTTEPPDLPGYWSVPPEQFPRASADLWRALDALGRAMYRTSPLRPRAARHARGE